MPFNGPLNITEQDIRTQQAATQPSGAAWSPSIKFGQIGTTWDGKTYAYALNGATGLNPGYTFQETASVANHIGRTNTVVEAIGSYTASVTVGNTAVTANQYSQGNLVVVSATGIGEMYRIKGNTACAGNGTTTITLYDPILVAFDTTTVFSLYPARANGVVVTPTSSPLNVIGVSDIAVTAAYYFWGQTTGLASVITDSNAGVAVNTGVIPSTTTAGEVVVESVSTITQRLGFTAYATTASQAQPVVLNIPV